MYSDKWIRGISTRRRCHKLKGILFCSFPQPSPRGFRGRKRGNLQFCSAWANTIKVLQGWKAQWRERFFYFSLFTFLTAYFIVYLLSLLPYPALANPPPLKIHKASSYLFTLFLFFFPSAFLPQRRISGLENSAGTLQSFTLQKGDTWKPRPLSVLRRDQEKLVCPFVSSLSFAPAPLFIPPSSPPFVLAVSPWRREADRYQHV